MNVAVEIRPRRERLSWWSRWFPEDAAMNGDVKDEAFEYLPDIERIAATRLPPGVRHTQYVVAAFFLTMMLIAAFAKVDVIVVGTGRLATVTPAMVMQPLERAIIRDIKVRVGDRVTKGQVLATLDPTFAQADKDRLDLQQQSLLAEVERLTAEVEGRPYEPSDGRERMLQASLYSQRQKHFQSRLAAYENEMGRLAASLTTAEGERAGLTRQLAVTREVEQMRQSLFGSQNGSKILYLEAQATRMRTEQTLQGVINRAAEVQFSLNAKTQERQAFIEDWRKQNLEQLIRARQDAGRNGELLAKAVRLNDLVVMTAPEDGVVLEMAKLSIGSVVREAESVVTLVPTNRDLEAEIEVVSGDTGYLKSGDLVRLKVDAFPFQKHGLLEGRLRDVGQNSFPAQGATSGNPSNPPGAGNVKAFHRARVELSHTRFERMPEGIELIPGMTLTAEIKVGSRSILSYFLWPILRGIDGSLREP